MTRALRSLLGLACLGLVGLLAGCSDKDKSKSSDKPEGPPRPPGMPVRNYTGPHAAGKNVLVSSGCLRCHNVTGDAELAAAGGPMMPPGFPGPGGPGGPPVPGGPGGPPVPGGPPGAGGPPFGPGGPGGMMGPKKGPDLGKVGKDPAHTVDWLTEYIRNPKSKKPDSKMPAFPAARISDTDLHALAEYLASLK